MEKDYHLKLSDYILPLEIEAQIYTANCACVDVCKVASVMSYSWRPYGGITRQAALSIGFFRQEHWSGFPFPPPGDLPDPGIKPVSPVTPALQVDS